MLEYWVLKDIIKFKFYIKTEFYHSPIIPIFHYSNFSFGAKQLICWYLISQHMNRCKVYYTN